MSYSTDKARILRAIQKHGRLANRDLMSKCSVYGENFKKAIKEIDEGNLEVTPEPIYASTLRTITHNAQREQLERNRVKYENNIKYLMDEAMKRAKEGVIGLTYCDPQLTKCDYDAIGELLTELGFKIKDDDDSIDIRWA
jgi:hypothetical protein